MKNKKGFTLVELLAVLIVLTLILVLGMNSALTAYNNSKRKAFQQQVRNYVDAAITLYNKAIIDEKTPRKEYLLSELMPDVNNYDGCIILKNNGEFDKAYVYGKEYLTNGTNESQVYGELNDVKVTKQTSDNKFTPVAINNKDVTAINGICKNNNTDRYLVKYISEIYGEVIDEKYVLKNDLIDDITPPQIDGYTFDGWYNGDNKYDFNTKVTGNITLNGKYIPNNVIGGTFIRINNISENIGEVNNNKITIYVKAKNATKMCITENNDVSTCNYIDYTERGVSYTLSGGSGNKTLYVYFADNTLSNVSSPLVKNISYIQGKSNTILAVTEAYASEFWKYKSNIKKIILSDTINKPTGALIGEWDVSISNDESVMAYLTSDYTLYLQGNGSLIANENSSYLFSGFTVLTTIENMNLLNTSNTTEMKSMFKNCYQLTALDLSKFDTAKVTSMKQMFYGCPRLSTLNINFKTPKLIDSSYMFYNCSALTSINLSSVDTKNITNMSYMFFGCLALKTLDLSNFDTSNVTNMYAMFYNCKALTSLNISSFNTKKVTNMTFMFGYCGKLTILDLSSFSSEKLTTMVNMFTYSTSLKSIIFGKEFTAENVTSMANAFYYCQSLSSLDLSHFNPKKVTNLSFMFNYCTSLTTVDLSGFDTSNVTTMKAMFQKCTNLKTINLSKMTTEKLTDVSWMFYNCSSLTSVDIRRAELNDNKISTITNMLRYVKTGVTFTVLNSEAQEFIWAAAKAASITASAKIPS